MGKQIESEIGVRIVDNQNHVVYYGSALDGWQLFTGVPVEIFNKINGDWIPFTVIARGTDQEGRGKSKFFQYLFISDTSGSIFHASTTQPRKVIHDKIYDFAYTAALEVLIKYEYDFEKIRAKEDRKLIKYEKENGLKPAL